jgi:carboxyl-terminal processing protease
MSRTRTAAVATVLLAPMLVGGFYLQDRGSRDGARLFDQVLTLVSGRFVDTVDAAGIYEKAARGLVHELNDPYTQLFTPKELALFTQNTGGRYAGVGMSIENVNGQITVAKVFPNTPAAQAGITEGDRIVTVDTAATRGWKIEQVSNALKGAPGTKVNVRFSRPGVTEPIQVRFTRAVIHIPAVQLSTMVNGNVGYIALQQFNETATEELAGSLKKLQGEGARSIVLDLRGNPGGILDQAFAMSNLFLDEGDDILSVRGRDNDVQTYIAKERPIAPSIPLVVLTDGGSASAAEIVAGALQDHDRALVVGTTSFGKGLVQTLFPLEGGYALKMTTAKWFTPSGRSIQKERKVVDGRFVTEEEPDSLETDSARKARPAFKSDAGRVVYGGGGITPDVIVQPDTISTIEQQVAKAIFAKPPEAFSARSELALELKPSIKSPDFTVRPEWRDELYRRLQAAGIVLDKSQYDQAAPYIDRWLGQRIAQAAFGDSAATKRGFPEDNQLQKALELLRKGQSQQDLFVIAQREQPAAPLMPARDPR